MMAKLEYFMRLLLVKYWQVTVPLHLRLKGIKIGNGVRFFGMPLVHMCKGSKIIIGDYAVLCSDSRFTDLGVNHPIVLRTLRYDASIIIGKHSGISGGSICAAHSVKIGDECLVGANVSIADTDFHAIKPNNRRYNNNITDIFGAPVCIENNVFIGMGSTILKGVIVGDNSIIGANSVITKNIPPNTVWGGNPARLIKSI